MRVNTFLELRTNHRFLLDQDWGKILNQFWDKGPSLNHMDRINSRVVGNDNKLRETDIPNDISYAMKSNKDRNAINDAIFKKVLERTNHSRCFQHVRPKFTVCIKASDMKIKVDSTTRTYKEMPEILQNLIYTCCSDAHIKGGRKASQRFDPLLKLYVGCSVMISENLDVVNSIANGSMCKFVGLKLKANVNMGSVSVDGYYVNCVEANDVDYMLLELQEHKKPNES